jgi:hypothetical protein
MKNQAEAANDEEYTLLIAHNATTQVYLNAILLLLAIH